MTLVLAGVVVIMTLACLAGTVVLVGLWRRDALRKIEIALDQLQDEIARTNSLLEHARSLIAAAGAECVSSPEPDPGPVPNQAESRNSE